jgi:hypothetical protein
LLIRINKKICGQKNKFWVCRSVLLEDNIKMDLQEVGGGRGDWMDGVGSG